MFVCLCMDDFRACVHACMSDVYVFVCECGCGRLCIIMYGCVVYV